ncbi:unnamed protein product [Sphacelaria rigidula]
MAQAFTSSWRKCGQFTNLDLPSKVSILVSPTAEKCAATFFTTILCTSIAHKPFRTSKPSLLFLEVCAISRSRGHSRGLVFALVLGTAKTHSRFHAFTMF